MPVDKGRLWVGGGDHRKLAVTIAEAAELLHISRAQVERLADQVQPYIASGGVPKWPIRELCRLLADCGGVVPPDLASFLPRADRRQRFRASRR